MVHVTLIAVLMFLATFRAEAQARPGSGVGQVVGSVWVALGAPEAETIRALEASFRVRRSPTYPTTLLVTERDDSTRIVATIGVAAAGAQAGRVTLVSTIWTPARGTSGAVGDVLLSLLTRLTPPAGSSGWRAAEGCTVAVANEASVGTDTSVRIAEIRCGRTQVTLASQRAPGGAPQPLELSLTTR